MFGEIDGHVTHVLDKLAVIRDRINQQHDHNFYLTLVFRNVGQKHQFLENSGLIALGDKFIEGPEAASLLGVAIDDGVQMKNPTPSDKWADLALEIGEDHGTRTNEGIEVEQQKQVEQ